MDFRKNTFYHPDHLVATNGKTDLLIHTGKEAKIPASVRIKVKRPMHKADKRGRDLLLKTKIKI